MPYCLLNKLRIKAFFNIIKRLRVKFTKKIEPVFFLLSHIVSRASISRTDFGVWRTEIFYSKGKSELKAGSLILIQTAFNFLIPNSIILRLRERFRFLGFSFFKAAGGILWLSAARFFRENFLSHFFLFCRITG